MTGVPPLFIPSYHVKPIELIFVIKTLSDKDWGASGVVSIIAPPLPAAENSPDPTAFVA